MSTAYAVAYRLGITPWDKNGAGADDAFQRLLDREERDRRRPFGRALDLGCGTGAHTRQLAARGWDAMGVDNVRLAVDIAGRRGGPEGRYVIGDVAYLKGSGVGHDFSLFLDVGCFHGLREPRRAAMGRGVTQLAVPGASLLMLCSTPHGGKMLPRGADRAALASAFPDWSVVSVEDADPAGLPASLRRNSPRWWRLRLG
jgi:SAM-dependent methyltransferase